MRSVFQAELTEEISRVDQHVTSLISDLQQEETKQRKAAAEVELEGLEASATRAGAANRDQHRASNAQKERAHAALLSAAQADRERLEALKVPRHLHTCTSFCELDSFQLPDPIAFQAELESDFSSGSAPEEEEQRKVLQERLHGLARERVLADKARVKAEGRIQALETELSENLQRRQVGTILIAYRGSTEWCGRRKR